MFKAGIIDPVKVVRTALENAASIAGLMLTTETLVTDSGQGRQEAAPRRGKRPLGGGFRVTSVSQVRADLPAIRENGPLRARWPVFCRVGGSGRSLAT